MRTVRVLALLLLALPAAVEAAVISGRVVEVDPKLNTMVLAQQDAFGTIERFNLAWPDNSRAQLLLDSAPVGFELTVSAERDFFDTWNVQEVLESPAVPEIVVAEVLQVDRSTGRVQVRDPVTAERHSVILESYRLDQVRPGGRLSVDLPRGVTPAR